ncbi:MAG: hypothetical protein NC200_02350 [Candidatus Gastranaerophilales bacterium]|nr:hypothetical protein [Candidatus Gastranaerophilales bacterium]
MNIAINNAPLYNNQNFAIKRSNTHFTAQPSDKFVKCSLKTISNIGRSDSIVADSPMGIVDFLKELSKTETFEAESDSLKKYIKAIDGTPLQEMEIKQLIGYGTSALALETKNGNVLKLTTTNHFPMNRPVEDFDARVTARGKMNGIHYYLAEKCEPCVCCSGFVDIMKEQIHKRGYRTRDLGEFDDFQLGFNSKGELKLLDPECAQYKTPFHKLIQVVKRKLSMQDKI